MTISLHKIPAKTESHTVKQNGQPTSLPKKLYKEFGCTENFSDKKSGKNLSGCNAI